MGNFRGRGTWWARGAQSSQRGPARGIRACPWSGGEAPWSWKLFSSRTCNGQTKFVPFIVFSAIHYNFMDPGWGRQNFPRGASSPASPRWRRRWSCPQPVGGSNPPTPQANRTLVLTFLLTKEYRKYGGCQIAHFIKANKRFYFSLQPQPWVHYRSCYGSYGKLFTVVETRLTAYG